jgi:hypothetical protein
VYVTTDTPLLPTTTPPLVTPPASEPVMATSVVSPTTHAHEPNTPVAHMYVV